MPISKELSERNGGSCELCNTEAAAESYTVSPKDEDSISNQVALCTTCLTAMDNKEAGFHWRCLEGSVWSMEPSVQALSYRLLQNYKAEDWASNLIASVDLDENTVEWAMSA